MTATETTENVGGLALHVVPGTTSEWCWNNIASNGNWRDYHRPDVWTIQTNGLSGQTSAATGSAGNLAANVPKVAAGLKAVIVKYGLAAKGYALGHSSSASIILRCLLDDDAADQASERAIVAMLKGVGISGICIRASDDHNLAQGGHPVPEWPTSVPRAWWYSGLTYSAVNAQTLGGEGAVPGRIFSLNESAQYVAKRLGLPALNVPVKNNPAGTTTVQGDSHGPQGHVHVLQTPGEGHVTKSAVVDLPASFWATMDVGAIVTPPVDPPPVDPPPVTPPPAGTPVVAITSPPAGAAGPAFQFTATVTPAAGVHHVTIYMDNRSLGSLTTAPYTKQLIGVADGKHTIVAQAHMNDGRDVRSTPVVVTVGTVTPPPPPPDTTTRPQLVKALVDAAAAHTAAQAALTAWDAAHPFDPAPPVVTPPATGALLPLKVVGRGLQTSDGKRWVGVGTNFAYAVKGYDWPGDGQMGPVGSWHQRNADRIAAECAGFGMNFCRLPVNNETGAGYVAQIKVICDANARAGIRTMLVAFGGIGNTPSAAAGSLLGTLWAALGRPVHVLLNTINEPRNLSDNQWQAGNAAEVAAIRAAGYTQPIFCDGQGWAWSFPVAAARALAAEDHQLVFMGHRYSVSDPGQPVRPGSDAQAWAAEWSKASDLCVGVGEFGGFNGGWGEGGSLATNTAQWCKPMADAIVKGVQDGWLSCALAWTLCWDEGSHIVGANTGGDWWPISQGEPWKYNVWGQVVQDMCRRIRALAG